MDYRGRLCLNKISTSAHAKELESILIENLNKFCPTKTMRLGPQDKPWINFALKALSRRKQREWTKHGKSTKYVELEAKFTNKYEAAAKKYMENKVEALKEAQPGKAYSVFKSMGAQPGDCSDNHTFPLPNHANLTDQESEEAIAEHFARISQEYLPLNLERLPNRVKQRLEEKSIPPVILRKSAIGH